MPKKSEKLQEKNKVIWGWVVSKCTPAVLLAEVQTGLDETVRDGNRACLPNPRANCASQLMFWTELKISSFTGAQQCYCYFFGFYICFIPNRPCTMGSFSLLVSGRVGVGRPAGSGEFKEFQHRGMTRLNVIMSWLYCYGLESNIKVKL